MIQPGIQHTSTRTVTEQMLASHMGSGDLPVLATPAMVALMENAAMNAVAPHLPEGSTTVGALISTTHTRPTALGATVSATAVLEAVEGRKLSFRITATDGKETIGEATHTRYIVDIKRFMEKMD